jgi:hypothetical protein
LFSPSGDDFASIIKTLPERWQCLAFNLQRNVDKDVWVSGTDQQRRAIIEALEPEFYN